MRAAGLVISAVAAASAATAVEPGQAAPACSLSAFGDARGVELRDYRGSVLLVDFWASWCAPCARAFPLLNELERDFGRRGFAVLGVNLDEDPAQGAAFAARYSPRFRLAADPEGDCPRAFGLWTMPSSYLIDSRGVVRAVRQGFLPGEARALREQIQELLAEVQGPQVGATR